MPFTLSHPLAVIPLRRTGLVFSAMVIGCMSPDFEYMLRPLERALPLNFDSHASHTLTGLCAICLPTSLVLLWLWHELLKGPLLELAPESHRLRLLPLADEFSFGPGRRFLTVCMSILVGALTHVIWDSFTHSWGWPVQQAPMLQRMISVPGIAPLPAYRCLQHASTVFGFLAVLLVYVHWFWHAKPAEASAGKIPESRRLQLLLGGGAIALVSGLFFSWMRFPLTDPENFRGFVVRTAVVGMAASVVQATLFALWFRFLRARS
ncbi:MAG: DUF4184 family protein [Limisphaerales bacterium]